MANLIDIGHLTDKAADLVSQLQAEIQMGGDLQLCSGISGSLESIASTLGFAFSGLEESIAEQVAAQAPPVLAVVALD